MHKWERKYIGHSCKVVFSTVHSSALQANIKFKESFYFVLFPYSLEKLKSIQIDLLMVALIRLLMAMFARLAM